MNSFYQRLSVRLKQPLPGKKAQFMLAPESRLRYELNSNTIKAGVLLLIFPNEKNELCIVFIKRPSYNGHHSGQISFPGGKYEKTDSNLQHTALRESFEEIGVSMSMIVILGKLTNLFIPISNYLVYPYIGYYKTTPEFILDKNEVEYVIIISLDEILNSKIYKMERVYENKNYQIPHFLLNNEIIWGATSMILNEFKELISEVSL